jgi:Na+/proline symporter
MIAALILYVLVVFIWGMSIKSSLKPWELNPNTHWLTLCFSIIAGIVGGNTFVTFTGFSYKYGSPVLVYFVGVIIGLLTLHAFNTRIRSIPQESLGAGLVIDLYPKSTQYIFFSANLLRFLAVSLIQVIAGGLLLNEITGIHYSVCTLIILLTITLYTAKQGFSGVVKTDVVQMILTLIPLFLITMFFLFFKLPDISSVIQNSKFDFFSPGKSILFGLFGFLIVVGSLDIWQRYAILKSSKHSLYTLIVSVLCIITTASGIFLISILLKEKMLMSNINPDYVFVHTFSLDLIPHILKIMLFIAILSAIMSTADTFIQGSALLIEKLRKGSSEKKKSSYLITLLAVVISMTIIANLYDSILSLAVFFANIVFAFAPFLILLLFGKRPHYLLVNIGLSLSTIYAICIGLIPRVPIELSYVTLLISCLFMLLGLIFARTKQKLL